MFIFGLTMTIMLGTSCFVVLVFMISFLGQYDRGEETAWSLCVAIVLGVLFTWGIISTVNFDNHYKKLTNIPEIQAGQETADSTNLEQIIKEDKRWEDEEW